jgi:hypothetical protein
VITKRAFAKMREERERRVSVALNAAERIAGMSREELGDAIEEDPDLVPLVTRILYAAGMNRYDRTLAAMGRALGDAVRDRERINEVDLILTALADLRGEHIVVLQYLVAEYQVSPNITVRPSLGAVAEDTGLSVQLCMLCLAALSSRGLVATVGGLDGTNVYEPTDLGRILLDVLDELD